MRIMAPSLRALLQGVIDYAGMYPPAKLSLAASASNFAKYAASPHSWLLGGFVCPVAKLPELAEIWLASPPRSLTCCVVGEPPQTLAEMPVALRRDLERIEAFRLALTKRRGARLDLSLETRLPPGDVPTREQVSQWIRANLNRASAPVSSVFLEAALDDELPAVVANLCDAARENSSHIRFYLKFRTGGLTAEAFPSSRDLARAMSVCRDAWLPYKLTAGLHHAFPHADQAIGVTMHGFVNVLAAAALAHVHRDLSADALAEVIEEQNSAAFDFSDSTMNWRGRAVHNAFIRGARHCGLRSFGSCSFDEPLEELGSLMRCGV